MSPSSTQVAAPAKQAKELVAQREAKIKEYLVEREAFLAAKEKGDKPASMSHSAKMSNRSQEIGKLEVQLAGLGAEFEVEPYEPPREKSSSSGTPFDIESAKAELATLVATYERTPYERTKHNAQVAIQSLVRRAQKAGHELTDPTAKSDSSKDNGRKKS